MARKKAILILGQSNADGVVSGADFTDDDFERWYGKTQATILADPELGNAGVPAYGGLKFFQIRMPVQATTGTIGAGSSSSGSPTGTAVLDFGTPRSLADVGKWVTVEVAGSAISPEMFRVTGFSGDLLYCDRAAVGVITNGDAYYISDGTTGTHDALDIQGRWDTLRYRLKGGAGTATNNGWTDGYEYPSHRGGGRPVGTPFSYGVNLNHGPEIEIASQMQRDLNEEVHVIKCAIGGAAFAPKLTPNPLDSYSWYDKVQTVSWHPFHETTDPVTGEEIPSLLGAFKRIVTAADSGLGNDQLDIVAVFVKQGETDANDEDRANNCYDNARIFVNEVRSFLKENSYVTCREEQIPVIWTGHNTDFWPYAGTVNSALERIAEEDPAIDYAGDSTTYERNIANGDPGHLSAAGYIEMARDWFTGYMRVRRGVERSAPPRHLRMTLGEVRADVQLRFERNSVSNSTNANVVNSYINAARNDILNTIGDKAWFLRQTHDMMLQPHPGITSMPAFMRRVLRIERASHPDSEIVFKLQGYDEEGRSQIAVKGVYTGPARVHYFRNVPVNAIDDDETLYLPQEYKELLVISACKRMSESFGNAELAAYYSGEQQRLWKYVLRDCLRYSRGRHAQLNARDAYDQTTGMGHPNWLSRL